MGDSVFANGQEVACKGGSGKSICAFPDVCFTPPMTPATPPGVPIPYPNTGMDDDTSDGSSTVKAGGQEVMLKNKSYFKKSVGDEAGSAPKKGVVTAVNRGKVYFIAWSMDVMFEGENVVRNLDMTTHNHASPVANSPPTVFTKRLAAANIPGCEDEIKAVKTACGEKGEKFKCPSDKDVKKGKKKRDAAKKVAEANGIKPENSKDYTDALTEIDGAFDKMSEEHENDPCLKKMRCLLIPYNQGKKGCCPGQTPHHLVEAGSFHDKGRGGMIAKKNLKQVKFVPSLFGPTTIVEVATGLPGEVKSTPVFGADGYNEKAAPCVCCEGENQYQGTHKSLHVAQDLAATNATHVPNPNYMFPLTTEAGGPAKMQRLDSAIDGGSNAMETVFKSSGCDPGCMKAQLEDYHYNKAKMNPELPIKAVDAGGKALPAPI